MRMRQPPLKVRVDRACSCAGSRSKAAGSLNQLLGHVQQLQKELNKHGQLQHVYSIKMQILLNQKGCRIPAICT